jgi:hypothetical protein
MSLQCRLFSMSLVEATATRLEDVSSVAGLAKAALYVD